MMVCRGGLGIGAAVCLTHLGVVSEVLGLLDEDPHGGDGVGVHHGGHHLLVLQGVTRPVQELHLLEDGGLARLPCTQQQELDLLLLLEVWGGKGWGWG